MSSPIAATNSMPASNRACSLTCPTISKYSNRDTCCPGLDFSLWWSMLISSSSPGTVKSPRKSNSLVGAGGSTSIDCAASLCRCPHSVSYTHLRAHETPEHLVCRLLLEKKKK
eukprot:TRINITY_DN11801_c0_g1_i4.p1 TRINITY_DN11801_c0_g1~~TRINITY_DN11801_c0_g1_i4.p1  ORF type:complete len:113 (-),score=14.47 TRINITY_DN11801_c0_g1_i4:73-411(-)